MELCNSRRAEVEPRIVFSWPKALPKQVYDGPARPYITPRWPQLLLTDVARSHSAGPCAYEVSNGICALVCNLVCRVDYELQIGELLCKTEHAKREKLNGIDELIN